MADSKVFIPEHNAKGAYNKTLAYRKKAQDKVYDEYKEKINGAISSSIKNGKYRCVISGIPHDIFQDFYKDYLKTDSAVYYVLKFSSSSELKQIKKEGEEGEEENYYYIQQTTVIPLHAEAPSSFSIDSSKSISGDTDPTTDNSSKTHEVGSGDQFNYAKETINQTKLANNAPYYTRTIISQIKPPYSITLSGLKADIQAAYPTLVGNEEKWKAGDAK